MKDRADGDALYTSRHDGGDCVEEHCVEGSVESLISPAVWVGSTARDSKHCKSTQVRKALLKWNGREKFRRQGRPNAIALCRVLNVKMLQMPPPWRIASRSHTSVYEEAIINR